MHVRQRYLSQHGLGTRSLSPVGARARCVRAPGELVCVVCAVYVVPPRRARVFVCALDSCSYIYQTPRTTSRSNVYMYSAWVDIVLSC